MSIQEYYGDQTRWFMAKVIDNRSPSGMEGMVQIRIYGIHSPDTQDVPQSDLPWAKVVLPSSSGGVSGIGAMSQLQPDAMVFGIFMDGKASQVPLVLGAIAHTELPNVIQESGRKDTAGKNPYTSDVGSQVSDFIPPEAQSIGSGNRSNPTVQSLKQARTISMKFFIDNGYTVEQAAGMTGVLEVISSFNPELSLSTTGFGIAQWISTGVRYQMLLEFSKTLGPQAAWFDLNTQLMFILQELRTNKREASGKMVKATWMTDPKYPDTWYGDGSVAIFIRYFVPNHIRETINVNQAEAAAQTAYDVAMAS